MLKKNNNLGNIFVIFGGTGDLTKRKLLPAIYNLKKEGLLPSNFALVAVGRRDYTTDEFRKIAYHAIKDYSRFKLEEDIWNKLKEKIYYRKMDFTNENEYHDLKTYLDELDKLHHTLNNRIFYLAVAPMFFDVIVTSLHKAKMNLNKDNYSRVVIEKPFGNDLKSAKYLNKKIISTFGEENTYRIDHYLGKEMLQNIMVIRFANSLFEPLWNNKYIEQVQIISDETIGIENRGNYYEKSGAIRDMVQSHMLQLLSLVAMEKPENLDFNAIRDEKVKVLASLKKYSEQDIMQNVVRGQYNSYRNEENVSKYSQTETFVALKLEVNNKRWKNVPFYIRTGKKMPKKSTEVIIQFKPLPNPLYINNNLNLNMLIIRIQPTEGVYLQFNAKKPGERNTIIPVQMDFCQNCEVGINSPEAYERLLNDVMLGDQTLFARWDEVYYSWKFIDTIIEVWKKCVPIFPNYEEGSFGPVGAIKMLERDGREWINI